jgi:transcriptional regulator with XRE-family HTH domain
MHPASLVEPGCCEMEVTGTTASSQASRARSTLQLLRERVGLSREALAALAGVGTRTLYGIEVQDRTPRGSTAQAIAIALDVRPADLSPSAETEHSTDSTAAHIERSS